MLHNTTREQLLQSGNGYVALVIDAAYFMGWEAYHVFTAREIIQCLAVLHVPAKAIWIALRHSAFQSQGQRNRNFTLPAASTLRKTVGASPQETARDELDAEAFTSLKSYRMALHHALVTRRPGRYLRHLLARRLGVCRSTTRNYDRALHHVVISSYNYEPLDEAEIEKLPIEKPTSKKYFLLIKHPKEPFFAPLVRQVAEYWRSRGVAVVKVQQTANVYSPAALAASYVEGEFSSFIAH